MKEIKEYTDWNNDETFENNPINISRDNYRLLQIRKYINTARKRKAAVRNQRGMSGKNCIDTRKMENAIIRKLTQKNYKMQKTTMI